MRIAHLAIVLAAALASACSDRSPPEPVPQQIRPAKLMTVESNTDSQLLVFTARIEALQAIDMSFEVGGPLRKFPVREGEKVQQGSLLAALDPTDFQLEAREAETQLKLARLDLDRKREILKKNGIAKSQVEDAEASFDLQRVRLDKTRERLKDSNMYAPFDAYVSRRFIDNFVNVDPGAPIVRLLDLNKLLVVTSITENLVATVTPDQILRAWVQFSFAPDRQFDINLHENRGEADSLAQTYEVSFIMDTPTDLNILPGMTAAAMILIKDNSESSFILPASAVVPTPEGELAVWVYNPQTNEVSRRIIQTLAPVHNGVPVVAGLKDGEQVVVAGAGQLQAGMKVRPIDG